MNILQSLMLKLRIKSLYIKWLLTFTGFIIIAQITTLGFAFRYIIPEVESNLASRLYNKAKFVQDLHRKGFEITEYTLSEIGDNDINFYLFSNEAIPEDIGKYSDLESAEKVV